MSEDEFTKLFRYMQDFRADVDTKLENMATKDDINDLRNTIDSYASRLDDIETDNVARDAQFERLAEWAQPVGEKVDIPLNNL